MIKNKDGKGYVYFSPSAQCDTDSYDPTRPSPIFKLPVELQDKIIDLVLGSHAAKYPFQNPGRTRHLPNSSTDQVALHGAWSLQWANKEFYHRVQAVTIKRAVFRFGSLDSLAAFVRCPTAPIETIWNLELWLTRNEAATIFDIEGLRSHPGLSLRALGLQETLRLCGTEFNLHRLRVMGFREDVDDDGYLECSMREGYLRDQEGRWIIGSMLDNVNEPCDFLRVHETLGKAEIRLLKVLGSSHVDSEDSDIGSPSSDLAGVGSDFEV